MKVEFLYSNRFKNDYKNLSPKVKEALYNKLNLLSQNRMHPSLRTKKIKGCKEEIFECSINMRIRMTW